MSLCWVPNYQAGCGKTIKSLNSISYIHVICLNNIIRISVIFFKKKPWIAKKAKFDYIFNFTISDKKWYLTLSCRILLGPIACKKRSQTFALEALLSTKNSLLMLETLHYV